MAVSGQTLQGGQIPYNHCGNGPSALGQILYGRDEDGSPWPCQDGPYRGGRSPMTIVGLDLYYGDRSFMAVMRQIPYDHYGDWPPIMGADPLWP